MQPQQSFEYIKEKLFTPKVNNFLYLYNVIFHLWEEENTVILNVDNLKFGGMTLQVFPRKTTFLIRHSIFFALDRSKENRFQLPKVYENTFGNYYASDFIIDKFSEHEDSIDDKQIEIFRNGIISFFKELLQFLNVSNESIDLEKLYED